MPQILENNQKAAWHPAASDADQCLAYSAMGFTAEPFSGNSAMLLKSSSNFFPTAFQNSDYLALFLM